MATATQEPGELNLSLVQGDDFGTLLDLSIDTTGYTIAASIYSLLTGVELLAPTVTEVDAEVGQWNLSMTAEQTAELPAGTLGIKVIWTTPGDDVRRFLQGVCEVKR